MSSDNAWRKSSYSGGTSNDCVLVRGDLAALRDTKNPANVIITVDVTALIAAVRADRIG
jgi:hypothetical protein